jgi:sulfatase maturation enzyme AslB (radical SAM superfamily)
MISYQKVFFGSECNNACVVCEAGDQTTSHDLDGLVRQIDSLTDPENLVLLGGEPTLHEDLAPLISYARRQGAGRIKLLTNGRRLAEVDFLKNLAEEGCRLFEVKVEGSSPAVHEAVTRTRGSFDETLQGLKNLGVLARTEGYEDAIYVAARVVVTRENLEDLIALVSMLVSFEVDRIILSRKTSGFPLSEGSMLVANALKLATLNKTWSVCEGFPPCLMNGCERHVSEFLQPVFYDGDKPKGCRKCDYIEICSGPPEDYVRERGSREFRAVSGSSVVEDLRQLRTMRSMHEQQ